MRWPTSFALLTIIACGANAVLSQTTSEKREADIERQNAIDMQRRADLDIQQRIQNLNILEQRMRTQPRFHTNPELVPDLTREQKARVRALRLVDPKVLEGYKQLLSQKGTGALNIFPDLGCMMKNVVNVNDACQQQVPLSNAFSFRAGAYGDALYHDLWFDHDRLVTDAFFSQGIITSIGNRPVTEVTLNDPQAQTLMAFPYDTDPAAAAVHAADFFAGVTRSGNVYSDSIMPEIGKTYLLRVIAYKLANGQKPINENSDRSSLLFHSLDADKRGDMVVAFTVVAATDAGGYTIVWKELSRKDAPKLKFDKGKRITDFRQRRSPDLKKILIPDSKH